MWKPAALAHLKQPYKGKYVTDATPLLMIYYFCLLLIALFVEYLLDGLQETRRCQMSSY